VLQNTRRVFKIDPQVCQVFTDPIVSGNKKRAWSDIRLVATNFLGNIKAKLYKEHVGNLQFSHGIFS